MSMEHGGNIFKFAHNQRIEPYEVIDFSANINLLGPSPKGLNALEAMLPYIAHYPDITNDDVLNAVADVYNMPKESILVGNGATELLFAIGRLPGFTGAFVPAPGFSEYRLSMEAASIPVRDVFYRQREEPNSTPYFEVPYLALQSFAAELKGQDGRIIVFLGNPNNPDGTLLDKNQISQLASMLEDANSLLVIDESFIDFIGTEPLSDNTHSMRSLLKDHKNMIIVHSLTKFYAVPGLRIGALFADSTLIEAIKPFIPAWSINTLAQAYTVGALNDSEYIIKTKEILAEEQRYMYDHLSSIESLTVYKPSANFILIEIKDKTIKVSDLEQRLSKDNIVIRNCATYSGLGEGWIRVAVKTHNQNEKLIQIFKDFFNN
ncbi:pyridoxal phosphate-dependent aminotransferase [Veillonella agrestimuris]|uniref:pyridoxal phosphate-dependent aminotransferase n=1 Tax=Veillonella agrestimuris TaxID=2941340 RepID=UPI00203FF201|nr:aminotransferase class I/II-fold pyridoxal phosphate-dependent enzyme [Veillonella agrestimuris]